MSPPHSMFISESADGQAKPEPMDQDSTAHAQGTTKVSRYYRWYIVSAKDVFLRATKFLLVPVYSNSCVIS